MLMAAASLLITVVLFYEKAYRFGCQFFGWFPKIQEALMSVHYDISLLKGKWGEGIKALLVTCLAHVTFSFVYFFIAKSLHQDIAWIYFLIFVPMICVASAFPSIGGLGVREAGTAYLFAKIGVDSGIAVSISLMNFLYMVIVGLMGGVIYVFTLSSRRIQHHQPDEGVGTTAA